MAKKRTVTPAATPAAPKLRKPPSHWHEIETAERQLTRAAANYSARCSEILAHMSPEAHKLWNVYQDHRDRNVPEDPGPEAPPAYTLEVVRQDGSLILAVPDLASGRESARNYSAGSRMPCRLEQVTPPYPGHNSLVREVLETFDPHMGRAGEN